MKNKGFTLVELSIVLVIIGLLIGGILVGQNIVDSAKINSKVSELQQYKIAIDQFKSRFNQKPGDSNLLNPAGDNNGFTNYTSGCNSPYSNVETYQAWAHLSQANMINVDYTPYEPISCGGTQSNTYDDTVEITHPVFTESDMLFEIFYIPSIKFGITYQTNTASGDLFYSLTEALTSIAIDKKIDDGNSSTGKFTSYEEAVSADPCDVAVASSGIENGCDIIWNIEN